MLYLDKYSYVEPNDDYLRSIVCYLLDRLYRPESIAHAISQHPNIHIFPNPFADYVEQLECYNKLRLRYNNSFDENNNLISEDNIIGLFGEVRLIKWLWNHGIEFEIIKPTPQNTTPDFKVLNTNIELYTPILNNSILGQITKAAVKHIGTSAITCIEYDYKSFILKLVPKINKKLKKQLSNSSADILICNLELRVFYKQSIPKENIRFVFENLFDDLSNSQKVDLDKQEVVQIAWHCWEFKGTETMFIKPLSKRDAIILELLTQFKEYRTQSQTNTLCKHFTEIESAIKETNLLQTIGQVNVIFTEGYDDSSILLNKPVQIFKREYY